MDISDDEIAVDGEASGTPELRPVGLGKAAVTILDASSNLGCPLIKSTSHHLVLPLKWHRHPIPKAIAL